MNKKTKHFIESRSTKAGKLIDDSSISELMMRLRLEQKYLDCETYELYDVARAILNEKLTIKNKQLKVF